jgi:nucleoside-triphosphatase THEP1
MEVHQRLNDKWIKASIIGTIWAASEIVLGSFLHNLKIPFSGNFLTAIGVIILISISYVWREKGLFWRAGIICALMKTISPSAVIFGPMIAIFSEALLMELSVRVFGRTVIGFVIGSMLAMSWNLFQKIINYIIFYGFNIVGIYTSLLKYAEKQLEIPVDMVWGPIILLLIIYCIMGLLAAILGIRVGRRLPERKPLNISQSKTVVTKSTEKKRDSNFSYSILWLIIDILLIPGSLLLINYTHFEIWCLPVLMVSFIWSMRYKRALRQLSRPKFWIFFVVITMLTAFVFTKISPGENSIKDGLMLGVQMNFRAVIVILGFAVLGTELYNPVIRNFFLKTSFRQLPIALELAFDSLPSMIGSIPDFKTIARNPATIFYGLISQTETRLEEIKNKLRKETHTFIIAGAPGEEKTTTAGKVAGILKEHGISVAGILSERIIENDITTGYDVINISNGERTPFLRIDGADNNERIGRFVICREGLNKGRKALDSATASDNTIIIVDEVGRLELEGGGWAGNFSAILNTPGKHIIITVRDIFKDDIISYMMLKNYTVFVLPGNDHNSVSSHIIEFLDHENPDYPKD